MLPRFHWSDITTVGHYLGVLILFTGAAMLIPALVALCFGEVQQLAAFMFGMGVCACAGCGLRLLRSHSLDRRRSLLLLGFGWIVAGLVSSIPLFFSGSYASWFDALFDAVSALTSTGVTLAVDIDAMSYSQITWHVIMSFSGAMVIVICALYTGLFGQGSKLNVGEAHGGGTSHTRLRDTMSAVGRAFGLLALIGTVAGIAVCTTLGMNPVDTVFNGFWLGVCAVSTSGFVPHTSDLLYYHSLPLQLVLSVLMLAGAISFGVYYYARRGRYRRLLHNAELKTYCFWIIILVFFVTGLLTQEGVYRTIGGFLQNGLMPVISAATTCGMQTVYPEQIGITISEGVVIWLALAILFGACSYSSGGGIKIVRLLQVLHWIRYSIFLRIVPDRVKVRFEYEQFGARSLTSKDATLAMTVFIMFVIAATLGSMAFIAYGNDALDSVFEALSYLSNCGMTTSITQKGLPLLLKVTALLLMWFGRVEFIALIAAIVGIIMSLAPENLFSNARSRTLRTQKQRNFGGTAWRRWKNRGPAERRGGRTLITCVLVASLSFGVLGVSAAQAAPSGTSGAEVPVGEVETSLSSTSYSDEHVLSLLSATSRLDQRMVSVTGEAIGSPLNAANGYKWVNIKDGRSMIGIYMTDEQAALITSFGKYEHSGDIVTVRGVFDIACAEHQGELEIHAHEVEIVERGSRWTTPVTFTLFMWGFGLFLLGAGFSVLRTCVWRRPFLRWL